jgi:hypothetical protein
MSRGNAAEQGQRPRRDAGFRIAESAIGENLTKPLFCPVEFRFTEQGFKIERTAQFQAFFRQSSSPLSFFNFRDGAENRVCLSRDDRVAHARSRQMPENKDSAVIVSGILNHLAVCFVFRAVCEPFV